MQVWLNSDGTRNREFRPFIKQENQANSIYLYDPNGPGFHYGLYDTAQPTCGTWLDIYYQYPSKIPAEVVDSTGRLYMVRPNWWRHGYKYSQSGGGEKYDPLLRHVKST